MSAVVHDLVGEVAIVTGAAAGVGQGIAVELARRGASVVLTDIDAEAGESAVEAIRQDGGDATFVRADIRSAAELEAVLATARSTYGEVTIAVANAMAALAESMGATVVGYSFLVELEALDGRTVLGEDRPVCSVLKYER